MHWYGGENEIIRGIVETSENDNECAKCQGSYNEGKEWICCTVCDQWDHEICFFMSNLSHLVLLLYCINRLYINRLYYLLIKCYIYG